MQECKDERGAVTLTVALVLTVLMGAASLALDLGMQRVGVRDMQALSDVVALDLARQIDGRSVTAIESDTKWVAGKNASVARNDDTLGDSPNVTAVLGDLNTGTGVFTPMSGAQQPTAVKVTSTSSVNYVLRTGEGAVSRSAIATANPNACFKLGSFAARVKTGNSSLLGPLLGAIDADLNLSLVSYQGLAVLDVTLMDVAVKLGFGTVSELVGTSVSVGEFYAAIADVLVDDGHAVEAALLDSIALKVTDLPDIKVGDVIGLGTAGPSALDTEFNVLDLVAGSAFVANGDTAVGVPALGITIPGLTSLTGSLSVINAPKMFCGKVNQGPATTSQVDLSVGGTLLSLPNVLGTLAATTTGLTLDADIASASGTLREITCGNAVSDTDPEGIGVDVRTGLTDISLGVPIRLQGNVVLLGTGLQLDIRLRAGAAVTSADNTERIDYLVPPMQYGTAKETVNAGLGLPAATVTVESVSARLLVLGLPTVAVTLSAAQLTEVLNAVTSTLITPIINPLITNVNNLLLGPVADMLGLKLGGADLYMMSRPSCTSPELRG
jgi:tight adherence protein G